MRCDRGWRRHVSLDDSRCWEISSMVSHRMASQVSSFLRSLTSRCTHGRSMAMLQWMFSLVGLAQIPPRTLGKLQPPSRSYSARPHLMYKKYSAGYRIYNNPSYRQCDAAEAPGGLALLALRTHSWTWVNTGRCWAFWHWWESRQFRHTQE